MSDTAADRDTNIRIDQLQARLGRIEGQIRGISKMLESEVQKLIQMEDLLARRVVGQDAALKAVANAIRRSSSTARGASE